MNLSDFDYDLPRHLIAQKPLRKREQSRLLVYNRANKDISHCHFFNLIDYLKAGDLLFLNDSKVFPARIKTFKDSGGKLEIFLLKNIDQKNNIWQSLIGGRIRVGQELSINENLKVKILSQSENLWTISFSQPYNVFIGKLDELGETPLPPYIKRSKKDLRDKESYQTVYARADKLGSVAAPTAGLHFTPELLDRIKAKGVEVVSGSLHVGLGTFAPIKVDKIENHIMHSEEVELSQEVINAVVKAKNEDRRIIAVGTTSVRILESLGSYLKIDESSGRYLEFKEPELKFSTDIFIYPPYDFKMVSALISNFHLPKSSLLVLLSALIGLAELKKIYQIAISEQYRFFSYGDALLVI